MKCFTNTFLFSQVSNVNYFWTSATRCRIVGIILHFTWLSAFSIMTYIAIDLVYSFTDIGTSWIAKSFSGKPHRVLLCWVLSGTYVTICALLDIFTNLDLEYGSGRGICFIQPSLYLLMLFVGPVSFLVFLNFICFVVSTISICIIMTQSPIDKNYATVFLKIGSLMGVTWLIGLVPPLTGIDEIWYVFIICNSLQGVYIFFSFGFNHTIRKSIDRNKESRRTNISISRSTADQSIETIAERTPNLASGVSSPITASIDTKI